MTNSLERSSVMAEGTITSQRIPCYCALCVSRCGAYAVVENGRFVALEPNPEHPTGKALCAKGRAAPELVYHAERLLYPLKRTRPKGDPDPGWERISWDEALNLTTRKLKQIAAESGPESIVFSIASPSTSASSDSLIYIERLARAFGSPNERTAMELCGWGRYGATMYTFGASVPGVYMPDLENAGCILYWGYNPNLARIAHAVTTTEARARGARLIVVDPRRVGPATKADVWLRVRPGTDAALALGIAHVMIERGWYDREFIRDWTNAPFLVRGDNGRLLRESDLSASGSATCYAAWNEAEGRPAIHDPTTRSYDCPQNELALFGEYTIDTLQGRIAARPVFDFVAASCRAYTPQEVESICRVERAAVERAAQLLWEARPVAYYAWSGVEQQTNATQIARAIGQLYTLTGSFDSRGGNVLFSAVPQANVGGEELLSPEQRARTLGMYVRPLGPARMGHVTSDEIYRGILERRPWAVRGMVGFGANLLIAHSDSARGREALAALDFYVHADLFMTPTAELADIIMPVASAFEREALRIGFDVSADAQAFVQLRPRVVEPRAEARADIDIVFDLACRLGLGAQFWEGDIQAAYRQQLAPSGISIESLRANPAGVRAPVETRYRKFADQKNGVPEGFATPSRKIELYSEILLEHGHQPLPHYDEPLVGPAAWPDFPLILTCAKHTLFCESQQRGLPSLRRHARDPEVELHPEAAAARGIRPGDWVRIETPKGSVRARARLNDSLDVSVVCGQHGWWQACAAIGAPGYNPFSSEGANLNLIIGNDAIDPISGSVPHRAYVCEIRREKPNTD